MLAARGAIVSAAVLDLYAGTGALGIEALSRGAASATFVEADRAALACLHENLTSLGEERRSSVLPLKVERGLGRLGGPFDLVLCDPPYAIVGEAAKALGALFAGSKLNRAAIVVLEHSARDDSPTIAGLDLIEQRTYGDTALAIYELSPSPNPV